MNFCISIFLFKVCNGLIVEKENYFEVLGIIVENGLLKDFIGIVKLFVSGLYDKDELLLLVNVNIIVVFFSDGVDSEYLNGYLDLVFLVNRRSKRVRFKFLVYFVF